MSPSDDHRDRLEKAALAVIEEFLQGGDHNDLLPKMVALADVFGIGPESEGAGSKRVPICPKCWRPAKHSVHSARITYRITHWDTGLESFVNDTGTHGVAGIYYDSAEPIVDEMGRLLLTCGNACPDFWWGPPNAKAPKTAYLPSTIPAFRCPSCGSVANQRQGGAYLCSNGLCGARIVLQMPNHEYTDEPVALPAQDAGR